MKSPLTSVRTPVTVRAELTALAKERKVNYSTIVRTALDEYIARHASDASTPKKEEAHA
jgi:post-segregation antitoxin (ccd killing protein)